MFITHKVFLSWLIYITVVLFGVGGAFLLGLPQLVLTHDHIYLGAVLMLMYLFAEIAAGYQAISISRQHRIAADLLKFLRRSSLKRIETTETEVVFQEDGRSFSVPSDSVVGDHVTSLVDKTRNSAPGQPINQRLLLDTLADKLYLRSHIGDFVASRIVWVGIFATIVGVIIAFWPFMKAGLDLDAMKANIGMFFAGIAVAFIPTAISFVFKIVLDINTRILTGGITELLDMVTVASETHVIPHLEQEHKVSFSEDSE